jgi:hypothetical protein
MQLGDRFKSLETARDAIKVFVLDQGESYKTVSSDKTRYIIECKDKACDFRVRATLHKKASTTPASITVLVPHSCSPTVHYNNKQAHTVSYLIEHHRASIINNQRITALQIRSDERLRFSNNINYKQAYRTIQAVLLEMYGDESESFAKFPAYAERFKTADSDNYCKVAMQRETGQFQAAFFALASLRHAHKNLIEFMGVDGTHTSSRFRMTLLVACSVDANNETLLLAWALVPIKCTE